MSLPELLSVVLVSAIWGATNPFIRAGSKTIDYSETEPGGYITHLMKQFWRVVLCWRFSLPLALNICGSIKWVIQLDDSNIPESPILIEKNQPSLLDFGKSLSEMLRQPFHHSRMVLFVVLLANQPVTFVVPVVNSLTFLFTALFGRMMGENATSGNLILGSSLILIGISISCIEQ